MPEVTNTLKWKSFFNDIYTDDYPASIQKTGKLTVPDKLEKTTSSCKRRNEIFVAKRKAINETISAAFKKLEVPFEMVKMPLSCEYKKYQHRTKSKYRIFDDLYEYFKISFSSTEGHFMASLFVSVRAAKNSDNVRILINEQDDREFDISRSYRSKEWAQSEIVFQTYSGGNFARSENDGEIDLGSIIHLVKDYHTAHEKHVIDYSKQKKTTGMKRSVAMNSLLQVMRTMGMTEDPESIKVNLSGEISFNRNGFLVDIKKSAYDFEDNYNYNGWETLASISCSFYIGQQTVQVSNYIFNLSKGLTQKFASEKLILLNAKMMFDLAIKNREESKK